ncbi:MAG: hypothetical protein JXA10_12535, partial [Anaerolineae bacterium]|nr:hypothetical protein [Anaerolineae bacterium]
PPIPVASGTPAAPYPGPTARKATSAHEPPPNSRLHRALDRVDQSVEAVAEKAIAAIPVAGEIATDGPPSSAEPVNAAAFQDIGGLIPNDDPLVGVLDVRGTAQWQTWKYMLIGGLAAFLIGGMINAGFISFIGLILLGYLGVMAYRTYRGSIGNYYLGFTAQRVIVLPRDTSGWAQTQNAWVVPWNMVQRLRLTDRYVLLDIAAEGTTLSLGALVAPYGDGGLGSQPSWLPGSRIVHLIAEQGFETQNL